MSTWRTASAGCRWWEQPPDMKDTSKYIEYAVSDSQKVLFLLLGDQKGTSNTSM
jgi:hypothetical protein